MGEDGALYHPVGDTFQDPTELQAATVYAERPASQEQLEFNRKIREGRESTVPWIAGSLAGAYGLANVLGGLGAVGAASKIGGATDAAKIATDITSKYAKAYSAPLKGRKKFKAIKSKLWKEIQKEIREGMFKLTPYMEKASPYVKKVAPVLEKFSPGYWVENALAKSGRYLPGLPKRTGAIADHVDFMAELAGLVPATIGGIAEAESVGDAVKNIRNNYGLETLGILSSAFGRKANMINYLNSVDGKYLHEIPEFKIQMTRSALNPQYSHTDGIMEDILKTRQVIKDPSMFTDPTVLMKNVEGNIYFAPGPAMRGIGTRTTAEGVLNHELAHSHQPFVQDDISRYSEKTKYYEPDPNSPLYEIFKPLKENNPTRSWHQSPDELHSELANIKYLTGVNFVDELGKRKRTNIIRTLAERFHVSPEEMRHMVNALEYGGY